MLVLNKYNNYINKILTSTELDEEQIKKCLSNICNVKSAPCRTHAYAARLQLAGTQIV